MTTRLSRLAAAARRPNVWIPGIFFGMFGLVIAANGLMVVLAMDSWRGLATESAYEKGVVYNKALEREDRELALGWDLGVEVATPGDSRADVTVALADADGGALIADRVRVGFVRPTQDGYDRIVELQGQGDGTYTTSLQLPLPGLWELRIAAEKGGDTLHETRRITVTQ